MEKLFLDAAKQLKALGDTFEAMAAACRDRSPRILQKHLLKRG